MPFEQQQLFGFDHAAADLERDVMRLADKLFLRLALFIDERQPDGGTDRQTHQQHDRYQRADDGRAPGQRR